MKKITLLSAIVLICFSCSDQQAKKQYFEASPEIDLCKKLVEAYNAEDWSTFKSFYCDTAKVWHNSHYLADPGKTVSEIVEGFKSSQAPLEYARFTSDSLWEMVITNEGEKWVHFWGKWVAKIKGSTSEINMVTHIDYNVIDGKIVYEVGFWDNLQTYLAQKEAGLIIE